MTGVRLILKDEQWARMEPHLPGKSTGPGRTGADNRLFIEAVLWLARTGSPWRDLPDFFGNWNSVFVRFSRWSKDGVWDRLFAAMADVPDFEYVMIDSTIVRAHQHAAGKKGGLKLAWWNEHKNPCRRRCFRQSATLHPYSWPSQRRTQAEELIAELPADHVLADKGYDSKALRETIVNKDAVPVIPPRKTSPQVPRDFALYYERNLLERFFLKIKHFRRIATRYDQTPRTFLSILCLVSAFIWTK